MLSTLFIFIVACAGGVLAYSALNLWYAYAEGFILDYWGLRREAGTESFTLARQYNWAIAVGALLILLATLFFAYVGPFWWRGGLPPS